MDVLIPDNWLREFLKTAAAPKQVAEYLSLCGPSIDRVTQTASGAIYLVDLTTNRPDLASILGIAREASAILPRFGIKTRLKEPKYYSKVKFAQKVGYLIARVDHNLCPRFAAVLIKDVKLTPSPDWMKNRLTDAGVRPINNVVDISNYVMHELGQPVHTFDYDKIKGAKMILRESRGGEELTTLDGKTHKLHGGDIVIEDGSGKLIDLAGIMGGENSAVDENTKNVLLFVQAYNPVNIRRTSMSQYLRTEAAVLFEKGIDPELVTKGMERAIELFEKLTGGVPEKQILDLYPVPYKSRKVKTNTDFISSRLGVSVSKSDISKILGSLGFGIGWKGKNLLVSTPSWRAGDITIPEDIVEEVGRLYGYHNLPSELFKGALPEHLLNSPFDFEMKVKRFLKGVGGVEIYTSSLVPKGFLTSKAALRLKNPLGPETEYLRTSLAPSLAEAARENVGQSYPFHLFEMANVYIPRKGNLPDEQMYLAGIFSNYPYREAKGTIESLLEELNTDFSFLAEDAQHFIPSQRLSIKSGSVEIGQFGTYEDGEIYYEFDVEKLRKASSEIGSYKPIPKYPAQIEDITFKFPPKTKVGEVIDRIRNYESRIMNVELRDIYKDSFTFRIWYQHPTKTLTDEEVKEIRQRIIELVKKKFGAFFSLR